MSNYQLDKVYFGAKMTGYTGKSGCNQVGTDGILLVHINLDTPDECWLLFYFDRGWGVGYVRYSNSKFEITDGVLTAKSIYSGSVKEFDLTSAICMGADVFGPGSPMSKGVPYKWEELFVNIYTYHSLAYRLADEASKHD